jgi:hypothetical protein
LGRMGRMGPHEVGSWHGVGMRPHAAWGWHLLAWGRMGLRGVGMGPHGAAWRMGLARGRMGSHLAWGMWAWGACHGAVGGRMGMDLRSTGPQ